MRKKQITSSKGIAESGFHCGSDNRFISRNRKSNHDFGTIINILEAHYFFFCINNISFRLKIRIILKTMPIVLFGKGTDIFSLSPLLLLPLSYCRK